MPDPSRIADSAWLRAFERIAVLLMVAALLWGARTLSELQIAVTEIRTAQKQAIVPGVQNLYAQNTVLTRKMLEHKWFGRDDAERLDDEHKKIMEGLSGRLRSLETRKQR